MLQKYLLAFVFGGLVAAGVVYFVAARRPAPQAGPAPAPIESTQPQPAPATPPAATADTPAAAPPASVTPNPVRTAHTTKSETAPSESAEPVSSAPPPEEPMQTAQSQPPPQSEAPPPPAPAIETPAPLEQVAPPPQSQSSKIMRPDPANGNRDRTPQTVTIPAGTTVAVRLRDAIGTDKQSEGDPFTATLDQPIVIDGFVIADRGALVHGKIASLTRATRGKSQAAIALDLTELDTTDGQKVAIRTDSSHQAATAHASNAVKKIGVGAVVGALIGAAVGGGKGAAIGAGAGGATGGGAVLATKGDDVRLASETRLSFKLAEAVTLTEKLK
jgi:hypothetical protein